MKILKQLAAAGVCAFAAVSMSACTPPHRSVTEATATYQAVLEETRQVYDTYQGQFQWIGDSNAALRPDGYGDCRIFVGPIIGQGPPKDFHPRLIPEINAVLTKHGFSREKLRAQPGGLVQLVSKDRYGAEFRFEEKTEPSIRVTAPSTGC